jgi:hypothetical protein
MFHNRLKEQLQEHLCLKKFTTSLSAVIGALGSPFGPYPESDLAIDLYSSSIPIANMDESNCRISFNLLNKSVISLSAAIEASSSPLGPRPERYLVTNLHSGSTPIAIKEIYNISTRSDQGIGLSFRNPSEKDLATDLYYGSVLAAHYDKMSPSDSSDLFRSLNT